MLHESEIGAVVGQVSKRDETGKQGNGRDQSSFDDADDDHEPHQSVRSREQPVSIRPELGSKGPMSTITRKQHFQL